MACLNYNVFILFLLFIAALDTVYDTIYDITVPKHEPIKKVYVELVKEIVEREEANEQDIK